MITIYICICVHYLHQQINKKDTLITFTILYLYFELILTFTRCVELILLVIRFFVKYIVQDLTLIITNYVSKGSNLISDS